MQYSPQKAVKITLACLVLHNMAIEFGTPDPNPDDDDPQDKEGGDDPYPNLCPMPPNVTGQLTRQHLIPTFFTRP
jgi:hypothetical protein